jgi:hypothetical protein
MAKTLDQLPIATSPTADDRLHIQQNGLDRQIRFGTTGDTTSLQETVWANFHPRIIGTVVDLATTAVSIPWENVTGKPTTTDWTTIVNLPTTLQGFGITGGILTGDLTVNGALTIKGSVTQVNTVQLNIADNLININSNLTGLPPNGLVGGINVNRGSLPPFLFIWEESSGTFRVGQSGSLQAVATRQDSPTSNAIPFWNSTYNRLDSSGVTVSGSTITGTLSGNVSGNAATATLAANINPATNVSGTTMYPTFVEAGSSARAPQTSSSLSYVPSTGTLTATRINNAVWNDIVDFVEVDIDTDIEFGKAYVRRPDYKVGKSEGYMQKGVLGIASDTYGFGVGQKPANTPQIPIAIGGFVLAYVDKMYAPGTPLTCGPQGVLVEFDDGNKMRYPERILAVFDRPEPNKQWNGIFVEGRCWVKIV